MSRSADPRAHAGEARFRRSRSATAPRGDRGAPPPPSPPREGAERARFEAEVRRHPSASGPRA
jgi:hypothetical protein